MNRLIGLAALVPTLATAAPNTLTSQGRLTDTAGTPINGEHTLTFSLYTDEAASSAALWSESNAASLADGYYSVVLGDDTAFPAAVLNANSLYLGVSVDSAADLRPREPVTASSFAQQTVSALVREDYLTLPSLVAMQLPGSDSEGIPLEGYAHRSVSDGTNGCYNWARTTPQAIDPSQNYEFSIWIQSDSLDMDNYFGFHVYDENLDRISTAGMGNPYFKTGENDSGWTRWTGRLLHHGTSDTNGDGLADGGVAETNGSDYVMPADTAYVQMRYGACYSSTVGATSDFALPNMVAVETPPVADVQVDGSSRNFGTSWGAGPTFNTISGFRAGSKVRISYLVPMRNNSNSWGGGYIEPQVRFNGGTWQSLGSSGYDGGVMMLADDAIGSYTNTMLIDPGLTSDFTVQTRFYYRSYDGTVTVNGSHDINNVSGTAAVMSSVNGNQHYTHVLVEEVR